MHRSIAALALLPLCLGCPKRIAPLPEDRIEDPGRLLELTAAAEAKVANLQGEGKLAADLPQGKGRVSLFLAVQHPDQMHLELFDFFGRPQTVLVTGGGRFYLYQAQEGRAYLGPATAANIARAIPLALPPEDLVAVLLGRTPRIPVARMSLALDAEAGVYVVTLVGEGGEGQTLWIHPETHRVLRSVVQGPDGYELSFDDFQVPRASASTSGTITFPRKVVVNAQGGRAHLELRYTDVAFNEEMDPSLFSVEPPEGIPVIEVR